MLISTQNEHENLDHLEALFECAAMGIVITDSGGHIKAVNSFALKEFGYTENELIGKTIEIIIPPRFFEKHVQHRREFAEKPRNRPMGVGMDLYALRKDGTEFPVEVSLGNYHKNGNSYVLAFISNISVRKSAEEEIIKLNEKLETTVEQRTRDLNEALHKLEIALEKEKELNELKSGFVSMASHEFRTPLSTVLSSAYLIEKYTNEEDQPKRVTHLQRIISSVNMMTDVLNDFLSMGKIEDGKIQVRSSQFNIREMLIETISELKNNLKKQQKIQYHHQGNPLVLLDTSLLKHIFMNLISNASKFSPETSLIHVKTICRNEYITLKIKDYGIGISKGDQKHLMERFFRGANAGQIQGTGLGLHIVAKYAELMNGRVECKSELEKGTEFIITFNTKSKGDENDFAD